MQEYTDRVDTAAEKTFSIDRFDFGLPPLSKNGNAGKNRWSFRKEGMQGRQLTCNMRENTTTGSHGFWRMRQVNISIKAKLRACSLQPLHILYIDDAGQGVPRYSVGSWYCLLPTLFLCHYTL
ncbi:hypothetical protein EJB05_26780, partial [Eragrostis curvula]